MLNTVTEGSRVEIRPVAESRASFDAPREENRVDSPSFADQLRKTTSARRSPEQSDDPERHGSAPSDDFLEKERVESRGVTNDDRDAEEELPDHDQRATEGEVGSGRENGRTTSDAQDPPIAAQPSHENSGEDAPQTPARQSSMKPTADEDQSPSGNTASPAGQPETTAETANGRDASESPGDRGRSALDPNGQPPPVTRPDAPRPQPHQTGKEAKPQQAAPSSAPETEKAPEPPRASRDDREASDEESPRRSTTQTGSQGPSAPMSPTSTESAPPSTGPESLLHLLTGRHAPGAESSIKAPATTPTPTMAASTQEGFAPQVVRGVLALARTSGGMMNIKLVPESLGALRIQLNLSRGRMEVRFQAANSEARQLLSRSVESLRQSLEARGLRLERVSIEPLARHSVEPGNSGGPDPNSGTDHGRRDAGGRHDATDGRSRGFTEREYERESHRRGKPHFEVPENESNEAPSADSDEAVNSGVATP